MQSKYFVVKLLHICFALFVICCFLSQKYYLLVVQDNRQDKDAVLLLLFTRMMFYKLEVEPSLTSLNALARGLNVHGLLDEMKKSPEMFRSHFVHTTVKQLTLEQLVGLIAPKWTDIDGSNKKRVEVDLYKYFLDFLEEIYYTDGML